MTSFQLHQGDCLDTLRGMADNSIDSIVTDPPYGLSFMGKKWDYDVPGVDVWTECLRVLKPGGHLLAFAGTRTQHRMAVRIENAGFEIRDMIAWVYGSGFPKSLDVSKAIDKAAPRSGMFDAFATHFAERLKASGKTQKEVSVFFPSKTGGITGCVWNWANGANVPTVAQWKVLQPLLGLSLEWLPLIERIEAEREVIGRATDGCGNTDASMHKADGFASAREVEYDITAPATEAARQWQGWGTALKPALEPITVARKPLAGTVAANVLEWGTGALNIDGCRVEPTGESRDRVGEVSQDRRYTESGGTNFAAMPGVRGGDPAGRWPANLIHDGSDEVVAGFPAKAGASAPVKGTEASMASLGNITGERERVPGAFHGDTGSAARFFYCAKASRADRNAGCEAIPKRDLNWSSGTQNPGSFQTEGTDRSANNHHPTVKPTDLMAYLVRLVTPLGGTVLDPFMGSGSTGKAAMREGMRFIGCELSDEYLTIARARIEHELAMVTAANAPAPQPDLFAA